MKQEHKVGMVNTNKHIASFGHGDMGWKVEIDCNFWALGCLPVMCDCFAGMTNGTIRTEQSVGAFLSLVDRQTN